MNDGITLHRKLAQKAAKRLGVTREYLDLLVTLVKQRLGISSGAKDLSIDARILAAVYSIAAAREIKIDASNYEQLMLLVDIAAWEYGNNDSPNDMPRYLRYKLNCLLVNGRR